MVRPPAAFTLGSMAGQPMLLGLAYRTQVSNMIKSIEALSRAQLQALDPSALGPLDLIRPSFPSGAQDV